MTLDALPQMPRTRQQVLTGFTVLSAVATLAAFPPLQATGLAWFSLFPLMLALGQMTARTGFWHGTLFGVIYVAGIMSYLGKFGFAPWICLTLVMALLYGLFGLVGAVLREAAPIPRVLGLATAWTLVEFARGHAGPIAFTFGDLAYSQHLQLPFIQLASVFGHYGVGFMMALLNAGIATVALAMLPSTWYHPGSLPVYNKHAGRVGLFCFLLMFANYFYGMYTLSQGQAGLRGQTGVKVAAIQALGALPQPGERRSTDDTVRAYLAESRRAADADLIVWPETAIPRALNLDPALFKQVQELARQQQANLLVGASENRPEGIFNSAWHLRPDGATGGVYRKMDLVIFGEYVPLRERFPFLERYPIRDFDYTPGAARQVFEAGSYRFAPLICFEGIFPRPAREVSLLGAELIVFLTSDEWALRTNEVPQHSNMEIFRAIESRKYVVRAATNGRSAIYDPYGETLSAVPQYSNGSAVAEIVPRQGLSPYHRWGDWPLLIFCLWGLFTAVRLTCSPRR